MKKKIILIFVAFIFFASSGVMVWSYFEKAKEAAQAAAGAEEEATEPVDPETTIKVFFGNKEQSSPTDCKAVFSVERVVPNDLIIRRRAIEEIMKGPTPGEAEQGYFSGFPTREEVVAYRDKIKEETGQTPYDGEEVRIASVKILSGAAYIVFSKEFQAYGGDRCRFSLVESQLREAMKQFPRVGGVVVTMEGENGQNVNP